MLRGVHKELMLMLYFSLPTPLHLLVGSIPGDSGDEQDGRHPTYPMVV
jgi:hypothetical protein